MLEWWERWELNPHNPVTLSQLRRLDRYAPRSDHVNAVLPHKALFVRAGEMLEAQKTGKRSIKGSKRQSFLCIKEDMSVMWLRSNPVGFLMPKDPTELYHVLWSKT